MRWVRQVAAVCGCVVLAATGCGFKGVNSLPLPGAQGRGSDSVEYHVELANVGTLESNSPVMIKDVVVGSVGEMKVKGWHADVEVSVNPGVVVPANAVATVGQTSLLGSLHLSLDPPLGQAPTGRLEPGATIPLSKSSMYPSTEQTLSALSVVLNNGGLGQISEVVHNFSAALSGREPEIRELLTRLDDFVGTVDSQRTRIVALIDGLQRLAGTVAAQRDVVSEALQKIPPALDVLLRERPNIITALDKLRVFSDTATALVNDTQADLVKNLTNLEPTIRSLADVGPMLDTVLAYVPAFPFSQAFIDRAIRGDYFNVFAVADLTIPRLKRSLFLGTRWGDPNAPIVPAPGDPKYLNFQYGPIGMGLAPQPADTPPPDAAPAPAPDTAPPSPSSPPSVQTPWPPSAPDVPASTPAGGN